MEYTIPPLVISMTGFQAFLRCRKSFELGHVKMLDVPSNAAASFGSSVHDILEDVALGLPLEKFVAKHGTPEDNLSLKVAVNYLQRFPLEGETLLTEMPIYTLVIDESQGGVVPHKTTPAVYIRTTFDRVYRDRDGWIIGKDYKTFQMAPSLDNDLDFQSRTYTGALMLHYRTDKVRFVFDHIRQEPPGTPRGAWDIEEDGEFYKVDAKGKRTKKEKWTEDECYMQTDIIMSPLEVETMWSELRDVARDLVRNIMVDQRWYRTNLKVGPHSCGSCFYKNLCTAELRTGQLTKDDIEMLSVPRVEADHTPLDAMISDPRVGYWAGVYGGTAEEPIRTVYGEAGVQKWVSAV